MLKKVIFISLLSIVLSACLPAAFIIGATAGGAIVYDRRELQTIMQDREITRHSIYNINGQIRYDIPYHVSVATFNGIVLIVGQVPDQQAKMRLQSAVEKVPYVRRVYNQLTVAPPLSPVAIGKDSWITTKVKSVLVATKGLHSTQIKVVTENKVVYLMGLTTRLQGNMATDMARKVNGVNKVVKLFEYQN